MDGEWLNILTRLLVATLAGGLIGLERSYHGRPAGFRTHILVCLASSLLMLVTMYEAKWFTGAPLDTVRVDPTRMAQGIMTGIGILAGVGFYSIVLIGSVITIGTLTVFRKIESRMPSQIFANSTIIFGRDDH